MIPIYIEKLPNNKCTKCGTVFGKDYIYRVSSVVCDECLTIYEKRQEEQWKQYKDGEDQNEKDSDQ